MHQVALGKRKRLSDKPPHALTDDIVETLNMASLPRAFTRRFMLLVGQHLLVGFPEIAVKQGALVAFGNTLP